MRKLRVHRNAVELMLCTAQDAVNVVPSGRQSPRRCDLNSTPIDAIDATHSTSVCSLGFAPLRCRLLNSAVRIGAML